MDQTRTELLIGPESLEKIKNAHVAIFGLGGVGGHALEAIARAGVEHIYIYDFDTVQASNLNRQIITEQNNIGEEKVEAAFKRLTSINRSSKIIKNNIRLTSLNMEENIPEKVQYAIDAIDQLGSKISLIKTLYRRNCTFISSMGAGNKLIPTDIKIADISKTSYCPLARKIRKSLRSDSISKGVPCVYSEETPGKTDQSENDEGVVGSISYVPGIFGLVAAGYIIQKIIDTPIP